MIGSSLAWRTLHCYRIRFCNKRRKLRLGGRHGQLSYKCNEFMLCEPSDIISSISTSLGLGKRIWSHGCFSATFSWIKTWSNMNTLWHIQTSEGFMNVYYTTSKSRYILHTAVLINTALCGIYTHLKQAWEESLIFVWNMLVCWRYPLNRCVFLMLRHNLCWLMIS